MKQGDIARVRESALDGDFAKYNRATVEDHGWLWVLLKDPQLRADNPTIPARSLATGKVVCWYLSELEQNHGEG